MSAVGRHCRACSGEHPTWRHSHSEAESEDSSCWRMGSLHCRSTRDCGCEHEACLDDGKMVGAAGVADAGEQHIDEVHAVAVVHCPVPYQLVLFPQVRRQHLLEWTAQPADDYRSSCRLGG